jgi:hypothetical protein
MDFLERLDKHRRKHTQLSRAKWLAEAKVAESCWYRWRAKKNSPTLELVQRLLTPLGLELALIWTPQADAQSPKKGRLRTAQGKSEEKVLEKLHKNTCELASGV